MAFHHSDSQSEMVLLILDQVTVQIDYLSTTKVTALVLVRLQIVTTGEMTSPTTMTAA